MAFILATLTVLGMTAVWQEPRPVPLTSAVRVVRRGDDRLKGINTVDVLVNELSSDSVTCGISRPALQQAAVSALVASGVKATVSEKASSWFFTAHVTVQTARIDDRCATSVHTELRTRVDAIPEIDRYATGGEWGSLMIGELSLIDLSMIAGSPRSDHAAQIRSMVHDQATIIGRRISAANK